MSSNSVCNRSVIRVVQFGLRGRAILLITRNDYRPNWTPLSPVTFTNIMVQITFSYWNCFLMSVTMEGKDEHGLKLEKIWAWHRNTFSLLIPLSFPPVFTTKLINDRLYRYITTVALHLGLILYGLFTCWKFGCFFISGCIASSGVLEVFQFVF